MYEYITLPTVVHVQYSIVCLVHYVHAELLVVA